MSEREFDVIVIGAGPPGEGRAGGIAHGEVELFRGHAALDGERGVKVGDDGLAARRAVVIATGSGAAVPPIDGLAEASPWDNREATTSKRVPDGLVVLGGGPVGAEMAQA